jgi:response regulator RpfG family c-di-GMP phosphodiesterase
VETTPNLDPDLLRPRVLCVDADAAALQELRGALSREFDVVIATDTRDGAQRLAAGERYEVLITDLRLCNVDGRAWLDVARELAPTTPALLCTQPEHVRAALDAVRQGRGFRCELKPLDAGLLIESVQACRAQHQLLTCEVDTLERTLKGCVHALTDLLALAQPEAFGRAARLRQLVVALARQVGEPLTWQLEVSASLSQVGAIALAPQSVSKLYSGAPFDAHEEAETRRLPEIGANLLADIPRFEAVRCAVRYQARHFDGSGIPEEGPAGAELPFAARALKLAFDFERWRGTGLDIDASFERLYARSGVYDPRLLLAFRRVVAAEPPSCDKRSIDLRQLEPGMQLSSNVYTRHGQLLLAAPQVVSDVLLTRLKNYHLHIGLQMPLEIRFSAARAEKPHAA